MIESRLPDFLEHTPMRLTADQIQALRQTALRVLGAGVRFPAK